MTTIAYSTKTGKVAYVFDNEATNDDFDLACEKGGKDLFVESVEDLKDSELVLVYNALTDAHVKKFIDRRNAIDRVQEAIDVCSAPTWKNIDAASPKNTSTTAKKETAMKNATTGKTATKKVPASNAATKKVATKTVDRRKWGAAESIRAKLTAGATDVDKIIAEIKTEFPKVKATRGYVRWLAKGMELSDQVATPRGRPAAEKAEKAPAKKVATKKAPAKKAPAKKVAAKK